jgi:predicted Zn finger-like uncharacterized protein
MAIILAIPNDTPPLLRDQRYPTISPGMRIVCPSCSAAYDVPDAQLTAGRIVRCARCAVEWTPVPPAAAPPEAEAPPPPSTDEPAPPPVRTPEAPLAPTPRQSAMDRLAAHPVRLQRSTLLRLAWAASLVLLVLAFGAAFAWRDRIVSAWPPSAHAYAALGMHPQAPVPR